MIKESVYDAFYKLTDNRSQIRSYVFDVVRATVPNMFLDDVRLVIPFQGQKLILELDGQGSTLSPCLSMHPVGFALAWSETHAVIVRLDCSAWGSCAAITCCACI